MITTEWRPNKNVFNKINQIDNIVAKGIEEIIPETKEAMAETQKNNEGRSTPGNPPAIDTGRLVDGLVLSKKGILSYEYRSKTPYSVNLEFGTPKMAARPFFKKFATIQFNKVMKKLENLLKGL